MTAADDLFAGAGGWDLAAARLGIHARGIENMKEARATRDAAGLTTIHDDVWTYQPDGQATGLIASPPCQTFSAAGKGSGRKALDDVLRGIRDGYVGDLDHLRLLGEEVGDNRTVLVLTPLHFALTGGYEWLAWEQVPTVLPVWEACADALRAKGWNVWTGLLQAEMFGVPQTRKRAFLLASRRGPVASPTPTYSRYYSHAPEKLDVGVAKWVSMAEGLGWDSGPGAARDPRSVHQPAYTVRVSGSGSHPCGIELVPDWCASPSGITGPVHRPVTAPAATVTGAGNYEVHAPDDCRKTALDSIRITVAEAGILQSFPADYPWQGTRGKQYLQAGNAVPPGLALHVLSAIPAVAERAA